MGIDTALSEISSLLGNRLSRAKVDLAHHGQSEAWFPPSPPDAVAYPESTEEVSQLVRICHAHGVPVIGWGAGTSLEGHALAVRGGVVVDFSHMNNIVAINDADLDAVVQPGITREELNHELRTTGLFFPIDPGANASLGGMTSTRASGTTAVRYGTMRDNVLGLEVVLADGRVIHTGTRARKSSAGYDLTGLFVGAEGTLGLITQITLRLVAQPETILSGICRFSKFNDAVDAVIATIQMGIPMARIEFVDATMAKAFNDYAGASFPEDPHLMVEFHGSDAGVKDDSARFAEIIADFNGDGFEVAQKPEDRTALWAMRHNGYYAALALRPGAKALTTDVCVPISRLAEAVEETRAEIDESFLEGPILGHVGDGNFHACLLFEPDRPEEMAEVKRLSRNMAQRALRLGGTITGEHGIGMGKTDLMEAEHGAAWDVMGDLKRALDPDGIMNPGKLVRGN
ncbi:FAD-binding oxidoreductase [Aliiroseovarius sp. PTFE2010]|uniref:FAD-binding oxidoreductase n=1 Tax=Aliiroseovarius sp. PTFE2010 TaxID=3417190 RepID=UPI003CF1BC27